MFFSTLKPITNVAVIFALLASFTPFLKKTSHLANNLLCLALSICIAIVAIFENYTLLPTLALILPIIAFSQRAKDNIIFDQIEGVFLCLFMLLGVYQVLYAENLITFYVGLELQSISLYIIISLVNTKQDKITDTIKYFVLSCTFSSLILLGISYIYGAFGTVDFSEIIDLAVIEPKYRLMLGVLGGFFILIGSFFKLAMVPFHLWVADIYSALNYRTIGIIAVMPKIAFLVVLEKIISFFIGSRYGSLVESVIISGAVCSIFVGSMGLLAQSNIKRFLAYSTIAQIGYAVFATTSSASVILFGFTIKSQSIVLFYMFSYLIALMPLLVIFENINDKQTSISLLNGIAKNNPMIAICIVISMLSFAGMPIFIGFSAKVLVFASLISAANTWVIFVVIVPLITSLYAYFSIIKNIYFGKQNYIKIKLNFAEQFVVCICVCINIFAIFFIPEIIKVLNL